MSKFNLTKVPPRPHTAVLKRPQAQVIPRKTKQKVSDVDLMRDVSGW